MDAIIARPTRFLVRTLLFLAAVGGVIYFLFDGIVAVHQGEATFSPSVLSRVLKLLRPGAASTESLTKREIDVLRRLADGLTTEQIATELFVSLNTVRNHVNNIIRKLNVHSRLEAVSFAIRTGLIRVS